MEGCWTVTISSELVYTFPTLLHLSAEEIVAIWDAVSDYILEQMKLDKGVLVPGLGLFAAVREQFHSKEVAVSVRRPVFQLDIGVLWLQDLQSPTDIIPDDVKIERLNYRQLSRATGISLHVCAALRARDRPLVLSPPEEQGARLIRLQEHRRYDIRGRLPLHEVLVPALQRWRAMPA
ncbi:coiled-coil domain-containing protein 81-like [Gallus gallus]|uniref:coiled-coil domain-containing protein 81-like n=1 Tax=Gallus gallus TaxID=9031 RepID=UPI001AE62E1B|nr:coiled-coil domain-containing protein 81-like [Gallus gallus]